MAILELARFHALSIALRHKEPEMFEEAKRVISVFPFNMDNAEFEEFSPRICEAVCQDPRVARYKDRIKKTLDANSDWKETMLLIPNDPWISFSHGDFWVNNIMFYQGWS